MTQVASSAHHTRRQIEVGMLLMAAAMLLFPVSDALAKTLTAQLTPAQIAAARFLFQSLLLLPILLLVKGGRIPPPGPRHLLLGALIALAVIFLFSGLEALPLANNTALFFIEPILLTLISALLLRERISMRQWLAVATGLAGTVVVLRPNWSAYGAAAIFPLAAGACFAGFLALTRVVARRDDVLSLAFWTGAAAALILVIVVASSGAMDGNLVAVTLRLDAAVWPLLIGVGLIAAATNVLTAAALQRAGAGLLAPFQYLEIVSATLLGWWIFNDIPDPLTGLGTAIIVASGLYVFSRGGQVVGDDPDALEPKLGP